MNKIENVAVISRGTERERTRYHIPKHFRRQEQPLDAYDHDSLRKQILKLDDKVYIFGQTCKQWCRTLCFLFVFYIVLFSLTIGMFMVFYSLIDPDVPFSFMVEQPNMHIMPIDESNKCTYAVDDVRKVEEIIADIQCFLKKYSDDGHNRFDPCNKDNFFGYKDGNPCIFLKLNRIIGFTADTYTNSGELPRNTIAIKDYIKSLGNEEKSGKVWLMCDSDPKVQIKYYPEPAISAEALLVKKKLVRNAKNDDNDSDDISKFYNEKDLERIIAFQVVDPPKSKAIHIRCFAFAKNIYRNCEKGGTGAISMQLTVNPASGERSIEKDENAR